MTLASLLVTVVYQLVRVYDLLEKEFATFTWTSSSGGFDILAFSFLIFLASLLGLIIVTFADIKDNKH